jgi:hypothetical protein
LLLLLLLLQSGSVLSYMVVIDRNHVVPQRSFVSLCVQQAGSAAASDDELEVPVPLSRSLGHSSRGGLGGSSDDDDDDGIEGSGAAVLAAAAALARGGIPELPVAFDQASTEFTF